MKFIISISLIFVLTFTLVMLNRIRADEQEMTKQTLCPVTGEEINPDVSFEYHGQTIYFCCNSCKRKFKADTEKYMKILKENEKQLESLDSGSSESPENQ
jgi:YHS domain-containing protein